MSRLVVIGNEKGGAGKSTIAVHTAVSLLYQGVRLAIIDLDVRQRTFERFFENRKAWASANFEALLMPEVLNISDYVGPNGECDNEEGFVNFISEQLSQYEMVIIDTPGSATKSSQIIHGLADTIITPMNDSFVDFDLLAKLDPNTGEIISPNYYAQLIWDSRKLKAKNERKNLEWFILRNRLSNLDAKNKRRVGDAIQKLATRIGFQYIPALSERVIYRELFLHGLTIVDMEHPEIGMPMTMGHVAARQELRELVKSFNFIV